MKSKWAMGMAVLGLVAGCGGDDGPGEQPLGGQYTVKTALVSTTCRSLSVGQGNTHVATIAKSGSGVTISDSSGLRLSGTLTEASVSASGAIEVPVNGFCTTHNTVNLSATLLDQSTIQGTARIQITYPASCQRLSGRTCTADLKYEAIRPPAAGQPTPVPVVSTIPSGTLLWGNATRLGGGGPYPAVAVDSDGIAHALYRRDHQVYYRRFDGTTWGNEVHVNDGGSQTEQEIKDRNLPKVAIDDRKNAWLLWGGDLPTLYIFLRGVNQSGSFTTPITQIQITDVLPNMGAGPGGRKAEQPEEVSLAWSNLDKRLHVTAVYIGDSDTIPYDQRRDGVYNMVVDPTTLRIESAKKLGNASKNLYTITGPQKVHGLFRLNTAIYFRYEGGNNYTTLIPNSPPYQGNLGALNPWTTDDTMVHLTAMSTYPVPTFTKRQLVYSRFNPSQSGALLESVLLEKEFASPIGIAPLTVLPGSHVFVAYDRHNPELTGSITNPNTTIQEVALAWRLGSAAAGSAFSVSAPFLWPGRAISFGQEPAIALSGGTVQLVWDGKQTASFDATTATFQP